MAEVVTQLDVQRPLENLPGQPRQQPTRADQLDTLTADRCEKLLGQHRQIRAGERCSTCTSEMFVVMRDLLQPTTRSRGGHAVPHTNF